MGIQAFFIVSEAGFPLVDRVYRQTIFRQGGRVETVTSMMSTVVRMNHQLVQDTLLSDIGLHTSRIFFDFIQELIFVLIVDENTLMKLELFNLQTIMKGTIANVKSLFQAKLANDVMELMDIESIREKFGENILNEIDEMIYNSYNQLLNALI